MLTDLWTIEIIEKDQMYIFFGECPRQLSQEGLDIVRYCDWRRHDK
jgi:hypothetical protein